LSLHRGSLTPSHCSGDSRLFLFTADGKVSAAVPQAKEGAVADFAWNPTDPGQFIVIAGRSPPAATLHTLPKGDAVFSFGTGSFNTVKFQPQGRAVALGGFGNMGGDVQVWDVKKCKPVSAVWNTPVATHFSWGPDGRTFLAATTRPRLNVDNGYRLYTYKGALLRHVPLETLFDAQWRPAPPAVFPDRAVSPLARGAAAAAPSAGAAAGAGGAGAATGAVSPASAAAAPTPAAPPARAGAYVPPHLRGAAVGSSSVTAMMKEGHKKAERLVGPGAASTAPKALLVPGMVTDGDAKKKRRRKKKTAGPGGAAAGAGGDDDGDEEGDD
jgi:translation initiation factor 2A